MGAKTVFIPILVGVGITLFTGLANYARSIQLPYTIPSCQHPHYSVRTLSFDPLIQHIEDFITPEERQYLTEQLHPKFKKSKAIAANGSIVFSEERTSSTAYLPPDDPVVHCISSRAAEFQGFVPPVMMEDLQLTRYTEGQQYTAHYDWAMDPSKRDQRTNRDTTFFVILEADCANCGTRFPKISVDWKQEDQRWCRLVDCNSSEALTVQARPGSATFWRNLHEDGAGDLRTLHAGLPVAGGRKTGLNIWTRRLVL